MNTNEWPEITVDTTLDELKEIHERIWNYAIEHYQKPETPYFSNCACCEYDMISEPVTICRYCPLGQDFCEAGGIYYRWVQAITQRDVEEAKRLATLIRDAPFVLSD